MRKSSVRKVPRPAKVTVRMPRSLWQHLGARARATGLSLNFLIVAILKDDAHAGKIPDWSRR